LEVWLLIRAVVILKELSVSQVEEDTSSLKWKESTGAAGELKSHESGSFWSALGPVLFLALIFLINFIARIIFSPLLPTIERELHITHARAGSFFFLISAGYVLGLLGSGFLASRATHKRTIVISTGGVGLALVGISLSSNLWAIVCGLVALGLAAGLYIPSAIATITSLVEQPHWGKAIAVHELAPNMAFFVGPFAAELFLKSSTWRAALIVIGAGALIASLAYGRFGRGGDFPGQPPFSSAFGKLIGVPAFWILLVLFGLGVSSTLGVYAMLPLYLVSERHVDQSWSNMVLALSRSYGPILALLGGWVSDWLGPKRTIVIALTLTGVATLLLGPVADSWIGAAVFLQPLLAVWFFPAAFAALAAITPPDARNLAVAFTIPFGYVIGGGVIPTFIGVMGDAGTFAGGFFVTGTLILSGGLLALLLKFPDNSAAAR
jgi:MFS transporter, NNP family, nitrate/nitrite transporter